MAPVQGPTSTGDCRGGRLARHIPLMATHQMVCTGKDGVSGGVPGRLLSPGIAALPLHGSG